MKRRLNDEGSVSFDKNRNRYLAKVWVTDHNGNRKRLSFVGKTAPEALEKMRAAKKRVEQGKPAADARLTVGVWLREWESTHLAISDRKETTKDGYRYMVQHIVNHPIGAKELRKVVPGQIEKLFSDLRNEGLSASTVRNVYAAFKSAMNDAVRDRLLSENPFVAVTPPRREKNEAQFLSVDKTKRLLEAARTNRYYVAIKLLAESGMRRGEVLALKWDDIDFEKGLLKVRATLARSTNGLYVTAPKTKSSIRPLHLTGGLVELLRSHQIAQNEEIERASNKYLQKGFVFATATGEPVDPRNINRSLHLACDAAGLPRVGPHTLRHSAATAMLEAGIPIHTVSRQLGHSSINITVDTYGHVTDDGAKQAMETLNKLLNAEEVSD